MTATLARTSMPAACRGDNSVLAANTGSRLVDAFTQAAPVRGQHCNTLL